MTKNERKRLRRLSAGRRRLPPEPRFECGLCNGEAWVCEAHSLLPFPHDNCSGPGMPCPKCNRTPEDGRPPRWGPGEVEVICFGGPQK